MAAPSGPPESSNARWAAAAQHGRREPSGRRVEATARLASVADHIRNTLRGRRQALERGEPTKTPPPSRLPLLRPQPIFNAVF